MLRHYRWECTEHSFSGKHYGMAFINWVLVEKEECWFLEEVCVLLFGDNLGVCLERGI